MSRAERRAYRRMTKNQDPYAAAAQTAARGRPAGRPARRPRPGPAGPLTFWSRRFTTWFVGGVVGAGLLAFSLAWPNGMPTALWIGLGGAAGAAGLLVGLRFLQGRMAASGR